MFSLKGLPVFNNVLAFKTYLVEKHAEEILQATNVSNFDIGYFGEKGRKLTICSEEHLRDAYLTESHNYMTFWLKPLEWSAQVKVSSKSAQFR